jgi:lysine biosynthesis protein LysW
MSIGICPDCDAEVRFAEAPWLGQRVNCPRCGTMLEVTGLSPVELDWAFEEPLGRSEHYVGGSLGDDGFA